LRTLCDCNDHWYDHNKQQIHHSTLNKSNVSRYFRQSCTSEFGKCNQKDFITSFQTVRAQANLRESISTVSTAEDAEPVEVSPFIPKASMDQKSID
jgi:hypothetical protein